MEIRPGVSPADHPEPNGAGGQAPGNPRTDASRLAGSLATPVIAILAVVCCAAAPLLLGALVVTGAGAWLAAHGYTLGAAALIVLAAVLAWRISTRTRPSSR